MSFDLQLYIKATHYKKEMTSKIRFRIGELHVVFCVLKVIEKLIDGSGPDQVFNEAGR